jgi:tRNA (guanine-N7-)-methyltransferase
VGKGKLVKWELMKSFSNVIEKDNQFKGNWAKSFFKNENPIVVELACGKGDYAIGMAKIVSGKKFYRNRY